MATPADRSAPSAACICDPAGLPNVTDAQCPEHGVLAFLMSGAAAQPDDPPAAHDQEFWLVRLHNGLISHHSYKTEASRDKWAEEYRARGDRVETEGVMIRA